MEVFFFFFSLLMVFTVDSGINLFCFKHKHFDSTCAGDLLSGASKQFLLLSVILHLYVT